MRAFKKEKVEFEARMKEMTLKCVNEIASLKRSHNGEAAQLRDEYKANMNVMKEDIKKSKAKKNKVIEEAITTAKAKVKSTFKWAQHGATLGIQVAHDPLNVSNVLLGKFCDTIMNFDILNPVGL
ncbi:hypothetical protein GOBAR_DD20309 [Gossypium barbadense]|nr:hypothetical protein GOBAR_DD20309 [Gossypium barbadense]